ncbi:MAG: hypothetical protein K2J85_03460, partial [Anaeroplasmataceae bacterium]|nr:hypothetical protein [Anaeroplasmataceae bacterium]
MYSKSEVMHCLECRWRKKQIKLNIGILGFISALIFIFGLFEIVIHLDDFPKHPDLFWILPTTLVGFICFLLLVFLPFIIYDYYDYKKILKLSEQAESYEVVLDHPSTSYFYRGAVYYT